MKPVNVAFVGWKEAWADRLVPADALRSVMQHPKSVLGVDLAPLHSAWVKTEGEQLFPPMLRKEELRREDLLTLKTEFTEMLVKSKSDLIAVEDYSYQSGDNFKSIQIVEYGTVFRMAVKELGIPLLKVQVVRVKSFAKPTKAEGKEGVQGFINELTREECKEWSKNRLGQVSSSVLGDVCDAATIALIGKFAIAFLENPKLEEHFPPQFIRMFRNRDGNGLTDQLRVT